MADVQESDNDVIVSSDRDRHGVGDIIFRTGGVERTRIKADGTGSGWSSVLGGSMPSVKYRLVSDGTTVTAYDATGSVVASGTDGGAVLTAVLPAASSLGATIAFRNDGFVFPWNTVPALPKGITSKLWIQGNGSTIRLSTAGPRFLDFNKTADHDLFKNIEVSNFVVDCNNVAGTNANHVIIGTRRGAAGAQTRINIDQLFVHDITAINVPTASGNVRIGVYISIQQVTGSEATQNYGTNILVQNVRVYGGEGGVYVDGGTNAVFPDTTSNVMLDAITYRDCYHSCMTVASAFRANANFLIGGSAYGGTAIIRDCVGELSGDVSIEVDSMTEAFVSGCDMRDAGFYFTNYHAPLTPTRQRIVLDGCTVRLTNAAVRPAENIIAYRLKKDATAAIDIGSIEIHSCDWYRSLPDAPIGVRGIWINGPISRLTISNCTGIVDSLNYTSSSASDLWGIYLDNCSGTGSIDIPITIDNFRLTLSGSRGGSGVLTAGVLAFANNTKAAPFTLDGLWTKMALTGMSASSVRAINLGIAGSQCKISGRISRVHIASPSDDSGMAAIRIGATTALLIPDRLDIQDSNFGALTSGQTEILFATDNLQRPLVYTSGTRWRVYPRAAALMSNINFASATFTTATGNQYIGGDEAQIHFLSGSGAGITKIEASKDGTTYHEMWTQASGAMSQDVLVPVDNGDYIKVTFATTQPTTTCRFRK